MEQQRPKTQHTKLYSEVKEKPHSHCGVSTEQKIIPLKLKESHPSPPPPAQSPCRQPHPTPSANINQEENRFL